MTEEKANQFLAELERLCDKYGAYCDLDIKKRPRLEHITATLNVKIKSA
jgi:hypothetical protein